MNLKPGLAAAPRGLPCRDQGDAEFAFKRLHAIEHFGDEIDLRVHVFGYLASAGLIIAVVLNLRGRVKRDSPQHAYSHESDWVFLILLLVVAVTGVLQHIMHRVGLDAVANVTYIVHLMAVVPMLVLEVPFGKWAHMVYRPLAVYFAQVEVHALAAEAARAQKATSEAAA